MRSALHTAESAIDSIDTFFDGVFSPLEAWLPRLASEIADRRSRGPLSGSQLLALTEQEAATVLSSVDRPIYGAGYCASESIVEEGNPLAWWQGPDRSLLASSTFGPGQAAIDLQRLEWYRVPAATKQRHIAGPFVDYLCSNEITLTSALPVEIDGQFAGVLCADVLIESLEELLLPEIAALGNALIVNASGRVVVSADPEYETGDRYGAISIADGDEDAGVRVLRSTRYPFAVVERLEAERR